MSDTCAYDLQCNANAAHQIYLDAGGFGPWSTYNNGAYYHRLAEAQEGVDEANGGSAVVWGTVTTGDGTPLNIRSDPSVSASIVGTVADGTAVAIGCQAHGDVVHGDVWDIDTDLWDHIGDGYVTDAYVNTGSNGQVAPDC